MYASTFTLFFVASLGSMVLAVKVPGDPCVYNGGYQWDCTEDTRSIVSLALTHQPDEISCRQHNQPSQPILIVVFLLL